MRIAHGAETRKRMKRGSGSALVVEGRQVPVSHLDNVLYPAVGFTKAQVIDYYIRIAPVLLPHLKERAVTLKRYPDGVEAGFFYEKRCPPYRPRWVDTVPVWSKTKREKIPFCAVNDLPSLVWAANLANLELHTFLSTRKDLSRPTAMVFDLDPGEPAKMRECARVGLWLRDLLKKVGLQSFAKTSGSKGLQVYAPLNTPASFDQTKDLSRAFAQHLQGEHPNLVTSNM